MKSTDNFKKIITDHLESAAAVDSLFAETLKKENKNIDGCVNYILETVKESGCNGFADEEIFNMAKHYYDEDSIKDCKPVNAKVVVNHAVEKLKPQPKKVVAPVVEEPKVQQVGLF